ncbi:MAG: DUF4250 domain-containing protein [Muribaculaceae bacterium]|nr:DUF4250 domain-containing protein [Bacteroides sp.]MBD5270333.1 DUF4250 domain-containing protein [Bacteroides sp.]MDE7495742.1 DUF4250 domain-containing protein [Muribaculaceae bacterium]
MNLPQDPFMLLSMVNMKLRDEYAGLDAFCRAYDVDRKALEKKLGDAGFQYIEGINQFR